MNESTIITLKHQQVVRKKKTNIFTITVHLKTELRYFKKATQKKIMQQLYPKFDDKTKNGGLIKITI